LRIWQRLHKNAAKYGKVVYG